MSYENRPFTGALFRNTHKKSDKAPDFRGPYYDEIDGKVVEREISAWKKKSKKGEDYLQFKIGDKFVPSKHGDDPDKIPF